MTDLYRPRKGDVVTLGGQERFIVVAVGRGLVRSMIYVSQAGHADRYHEIDYWISVGRIKLVSRKPANIKWARDYTNRHHELPLV